MKKELKSRIYSGSTEMSSPEKQEIGSSKRNLHSSGRLSNPGPGDYNPNPVKLKHPSVIFGTAKRNSDCVELNPGPADYDVARSLDHKGFTFTKDKKIKFFKYDGPGPGQYLIPNTIGSV